MVLIFLSRQETILDYAVNLQCCTTKSFKKKIRLQHFDYPAVITPELKDGCFFISSGPYGSSIITTAYSTFLDELSLVL